MASALWVESDSSASWSLVRLRDMRVLKSDVLCWRKEQLALSSRVSPGWIVSGVKVIVTSLVEVTSMVEESTPCVGRQRVAAVMTAAFNRLVVETIIVGS